MAQTDLEDKKQGFSFAGMLNGIKSAFGFGGQQFIKSPTSGSPNVRVPVPQSQILYAKARSSSGQNRMKLCENKMRMWRNDFCELIEDRLRENFHPDNYARMKLMPHKSSNLLERVIKDISITYASPPTRSLKNGSDEKLKEVFEKLALDATMETVEWHARFLPCVWVRPYVRYGSTTKIQNEAGVEEEGGDPAAGEVDFIIYTPDQADIVPDPTNPKEPMAFYYFSEEVDSEGRTVKRVNLWSKELYIKLDAEWRVLSTAPNDYGQIPVVAFRLGVPVNSYYMEGVGNDLYEGTLELAVLRTIQNGRARDSGFKQVVLSGTNEEDVPADQVMGGPTPLYTNEGGSASVLDLQPNLEEWTNLCRERSLELSAKYGISAAEYKAESTPQSGFAKKLDREKVLQENRRTRKFFVKGEQELYKLLAVVLEQHPVAGLELPVGDLVVDFAEPEFAENPESQAKVDSIRIKLNIDSIVDILRRENPDLSDDELLELAAEKKRINETLISSESMSVIDILAGLKGTDVQGQNSAPPGESVDNNANPEPAVNEVVPQ